MKLIKLSSVLLLTALMMCGFTSQVEAKSHTHKHYHKSKSRSTSFGFNLNLDPWPRQTQTVVVQPAPVERVTVYNPPVYHAPVYNYPAPASYVEQRTFYPGYYQENIVVQRPAPVYVHPQQSYWSSGWFY